VSLLTQHELGGGIWEQISPLAGICRKTSDQTVASTTLADCTGMSLEVRANTDYFFEFFLIHASAAATTGLKVAVTCPASPTYIVYRTEISVTNTANGTDNIESETEVASGGDHTAASQFGTGNSLAVVKGVLSNGATSGLLTLQIAGDAAANLTAKKGSYGRLWV
jgi:hypothetical protein